MTNLTTQVCQAFLVENQNLRHRKQKKAPLMKRGTPPVVKPENRLWYVVFVWSAMELKL